jgi:hypothetical protein
VGDGGGDYGAAQEERSERGINEEGATKSRHRRLEKGECRDEDERERVDVQPGHDAAANPEGAPRDGEEESAYYDMDVHDVPSRLLDRCVDVIISAYESDY